jgi:hypothetical protein
VGPRAAAVFLNEIRQRNHFDVRDALFGLQLDSEMLPYVSEALEGLHRLCTDFTIGGAATRRYAELVLELADTLHRPDGLESYKSPAESLPRFYAWRDDRRLTAAEERAFLSTIRSACAGGRNRPATVLAVGSTYLRLIPGEFVGIIQSIGTVMKRDQGELGHWLANSPQRAPRHRGIFLARMLIAASERRNGDVESVWDLAYGILLTMSPGAQEEVYSQLRHSLSGQDIPKWIRRKLEGAEAPPSNPDWGGRR